jgi:hypothetical protein
VAPRNIRPGSDAGFDELDHGVEIGKLLAGRAPLVEIEPVVQT